MPAVCCTLVSVGHHLQSHVRPPSWQMPSCICGKALPVELAFASVAYGALQICTIAGPDTISPMTVFVRPQGCAATAICCRASASSFAVLSAAVHQAESCSAACLAFTKAELQAVYHRQGTNQAPTQRLLHSTPGPFFVSSAFCWDLLSVLPRVWSQTGAGTVLLVLLLHPELLQDGKFVQTVSCT